MARWAWLLLVPLIGCGASAPEIWVMGELPTDANPPIFLTAARQKDEIAQALRQAGFQLADRVDATPYLLRVNLGTNQGSQSCGTLNNVRYELRKLNQTIMLAEAKGWTGSCEPSVFAAVSKALRERLLDTAKGRTTP